MSRFFVNVYEHQEGVFSVKCSRCTFRVEPLDDYWDAEAIKDAHYATHYKEEAA